MSTGVMCMGILPAAGDEALVTGRSAPNATGARWLRVRAVRPCADPGWAWLTGDWTDHHGGTGHVMVWVDHLLIRKHL